MKKVPISILTSELCSGCAGTKKRINRRGKLAKCSACLGSGKDLHYWTPEEITKYRKAFMIATIRRSSYRWPFRNVATQDAKVGRNQYKCAACSAVIANKNKKLDHKNPVVDPMVGYINCEVFANRALIDIKGWQVLCEVCHNKKTEAERAVRKSVKQGVT